MVHANALSFLDDLRYTTAIIITIIIKGWGWVGVGGRRKTRSLLTLPEVFSELVGEAVDGSLEGDPQLLVQHDVCWGVGFSAETATCCRLQLEVLLYVLSNRWQ